MRKPCRKDDRPHSAPGLADQETRDHERTREPGDGSRNQVPGTKDQYNRPVRRSFVLACVWAAVVTPAGLQGQGAARSPRNANYDIDVSLDTADRALHGRETIQWRNISG